MNKGKQEVTDELKLRKKAEEILKDKHERNELPVVDIDDKKLLHELQVHQIELEMQNEELRQAIEATEMALKKYTMLFDLAPAGFLTLDRESMICDLNFTAADLLGERRFSLVNDNIKLYIDNDSLPVFNNFLSKVFESRSKQSCEVKIGNDNKHLHTFIEGIITGDDDRCLLSLIDISRFR